jgi:hypothetical protein
MQALEALLLTGFPSIRVSRPALEAPRFLFDVGFGAVGVGYGLGDSVSSDVCPFSVLMMTAGISERPIYWVDH